MTAYYNENDPFAAEWLENLIREGLVASGDVDRRSIVDVTANDIKGYTQVHLFAGIGGWSYALRLAGWPDDRPVLTGSCPCQPFSNAGKGKGIEDERHLWPEMFRLIKERGFSTIIGEQVASKAGREWLSGVFADLESVGYAVSGADLCAASVAAPHIRQRLWWVGQRLANTSGTRAGWDAGTASRPEASGGGTWGENGQRSGDAPLSGGATGGMADSDFGRLEGTKARGREASHDAQWCRNGSVSGRMVYPDGSGWEQGRQTTSSTRQGDSSVATSSDGGMADAHGERRCVGPAGREDATDVRGAGEDVWRGIYVHCADGKARRIEPGLEPLAHGVPGRVGLLRGYGNAIVPQVAKVFIESVMESAIDLGWEIE